MRSPVFTALFLTLLTVAASAETSLQLAPRSIGPAGMSGRITSIAVDPGDRDIWYIGTASGGLWKTRNSGTSFEPIFDEQPVQSIGAVALAPSNPAIVYAGSGEGNPRNSQSSGNGLYKSFDGGRSWQHLGLEESRNIHRLLVHPRDEQIVWAGVLGDPFRDSDSRGVYRSGDGGASWERILFSNRSSGVADLVMDPENPNKLFAALWDFRRSPWDFRSGGPGSGLFMTVDGGASWQELGPEQGLPEKPYGRIGIAIAPSDVNRVYAIIESAKNALYRSDDGGHSWSLVNSDTIGSRPFYFADLRVDSQNENRVYNLYSRLARSEDGGEEFSVIEDWGREVHADHHAFWIDPDDADFIIDGTDGGLYWSHDRGENWRFAENLPLGQFYHVTLDDKIPYNVYGGLQDNGTWYGPSEVWNRAGIRNSYWRELAFNDGFDVVLAEESSDTVYALWQGGMLVRIDKRTGQRKTIMPVEPEQDLRFNWNAAIAGDPFDPDTLYIGSQFVHQSSDRGESWRIISPDLTTNDSSKQQQVRSGGLSIDATAAENHTTITAISPSALEKGLLWVGSDDGRIHLTRDGGCVWEDVSAGMPGAPEAGWIRQIVASKHQPGAAFVVIDNHLQGDWQPYVFHTSDFGKSWRNLLQGQSIPAYALSFVQDPVEPRLMFAGTEFGLYVSLDAGENWEPWRTGFPAVSTMDLQIQERERDLVIGTFGRSIWVLDDLEPWRRLAANPGLTQQALHVFEPADTYQPVIDQAPGQRLSPDSLYSGDNNAREALISFWVANPDVKRAKLSVERDGKLLRTWEQEARQGLNRSHWDLQLEGREIYGPLMSPVLEKPLAAPGQYTVTVSAGEASARTLLTVLPDPRVNYDPEAYAANLAFRDTLEQLQEQADATLAALACMDEQAEEAAAGRSASQVASLREAIDRVWAQIEFRDIQGVVSHSNKLAHQLSRAFYFNHSPYEPLTQNDRRLMEALRQQAASVQRSFETLQTEHWMPLTGELKAGNGEPACTAAAELSPPAEK